VADKLSSLINNDKSPSNKITPEKLFDYIISKDEMFYFEDIDFHILDLKILLGNNPS
jgi:hypothetical protein